MRTLIAGNWKMYKTGIEAENTVRELARLLKNKNYENRDILIFAPFTALEATANAMREVLPLGMTGAQNMYPAEEGAFTGEIAPRMIFAAGASWVLTGHSERRHILGEDDDMVGRKTAFALAHGICVTMCIGETLAEREAGQLALVLERQLRRGLAQFSVEESDPTSRLSEGLAVAYEPVWAIGTGKTAKPEDILQAHALTRRFLENILGAEGSKVRILYGGSVKPDNAATILALDNVDGLLVGGASLQAETFSQIITA